MQISRHWRLNPQRYRLQGVRYEDGRVSLQDRPQPQPEEPRAELRDLSVSHKVTLKAAS